MAGEETRSGVEFFAIQEGSAGVDRRMRMVRFASRGFNSKPGKLRSFKASGVPGSVGDS